MWRAPGAIRWAATGSPRGPGTCQTPDSSGPDPEHPGALRGEAMQTITQTAAGTVGTMTAYAVKGAELLTGTPPVSLTDAAGREILSLGAVGRPVKFSSPVQ